MFQGADMRLRSSLIALSFLLIYGEHVDATGLELLPATGFSVAANSDFEGSLAGNTAYKECNTSGNYTSSSAIAPTPNAFNACALFPSGGVNPGSPVAGFTNVPLSVAKQFVVVTATANGSPLISMRQRVYRNASNTECIFEKRITTQNDLLLSINDIALGGFSATTDVSAGYYLSANGGSPVFRIGRAFTSVEMKSNGSLPASGYYRRPLVAPAPPATTEINGVGQSSSAPTQSQQTSTIRTNWVVFTMDVSGNISDSAFLYVRANCGAGNESIAFPTTNNTVRIRQTGHDDQPWLTIVTNGITRSGANGNF